MTAKDFWHSSTVAVLGGGSWGTILANLMAANSREVRLFTRTEEHARAINSTRTNAKYLGSYPLDPKIRAVSEIEKVFEGGGVRALIVCLPSRVVREEARKIAPFLQGDEVVFHATKGIEAGSLKRMSEILGSELPCARMGVISGPNLALEIARGDPSATVVASSFDEVVSAGMNLLVGDKFRVYGSSDVVGTEWAGALKNVFAIASGALEAYEFGWNAKAMMITRGLAEMARFGRVMGAKQETFLGLAGLGDLLATCGSSLSRNYRVGFRMARGEPLEKVLGDLGGVAEGVRTSQIVRDFALTRELDMPISCAVANIIEGKANVKDALHALMTRPLKTEL